MNEPMKRQTILIVDDVKANIDILAELLKAEYKVRAATDGEKPWRSPFPTIPRI